MATTAKKTLIVFPCMFPIKIFGLNHVDLIPEVVAILSAHAESFNPAADIQVRHSAAGNYVAITATILAQSQQQLDEIYTTLNTHHLVKVTL